MRPWHTPRTALHRTNALISWPGCGGLLFWQLGALEHLASKTDLTDVAMLGSSSGAFVATMGACGVDCNTAAGTLVDILERQHRDRGSTQQRALLGLLSLPLLGGPLRRWLCSHLPPNAAELCNQRATILLTSVPDFRTHHVDVFGSREEVLDAAMGSVHLPYVLDGKATAAFGRHQVIDGGFHWWLNRSKVEYSIPGDPRPHIMLSPVMDPKVLDSWKRFQSLNLGDIGARAYELYQLGRTFEDRHHRRHHAVSHPAAELLGSGRSTSSQRAFLYDM